MLAFFSRRNSIKYYTPRIKDIPSYRRKKKKGGGGCDDNCSSESVPTKTKHSEAPYARVDRREAGEETGGRRKRPERLGRSAPGRSGAEAAVGAAGADDGEEGGRSSSRGAERGNSLCSRLGLRQQRRNMIRMKQSKALREGGGIITMETH